MSIFLPECNVTLIGANLPVRLTLPGTTTMSKAASAGCVTAFWFRSPTGGYDQNVTRTLLARNTGGTGGADAFIAINQAATTLTAQFRNGGINYTGTALSCTIIPGRTYLVMFIVTQNNIYLVACEPGGVPIISQVAQTSSNMYNFNLSALTVFDAIGSGNTSSTVSAHYGPIGEVCFWQGMFPETVSAVLPDSAPIQNIANGTQDLATVHSAVLTSGVKKCRYRLITADDLIDSFGIAANLTPVNTTTDKVIGSSGPLRPIALSPAFNTTQASQLTFPTPGSLTGAVAIINIPAGTYAGISPVAIQARLLKEDRSVLTTWETVATPSAGAWAESRFAAAQPYTAGWLECQFKAIDGAGAQLGDIVSAYGMVGTGFNIITESQSQLLTLFDTGAGVAIPAGIRLQVSHFTSATAATLATSPAQTRALHTSNPINRIARGVRTFGMEINAIFPGVPISITAIGVVGQSIEQFLSGGTCFANWANMKALMGVTHPYYPLMYGHSTLTGTPTTAQYETLIGQVISQFGSTFPTISKTILCPTDRYAGASAAIFAQVSIVRTAMRDYCLHNPTLALMGGSWQTMKNDQSDGSTGGAGNPHPADLAVGHGRSGSYMAIALMSASGAVKQQPLQISSFTSSGTTARIKMGPPNLKTA